jgi:thiol-disulfide isomerase/thioredoxin
MEGFDWPKAHDQPLYGLVPLGDGIHPMMIDRYDDQYDLYVDAELTGELQLYSWDRTLYDGRLLASVPFQIQYFDEETASYQLFLIWSQFTPTVMTYCRDSYRAGEIQLASDVYKLAVFDEDSDGRYDDLDDGTLLIDADGNGELLMESDSHEVFSLAEPINLGGIVYEVSAMAQDGSWLEMMESDVVVAPKLPLLAGFPAPIFEGIDSVGNDFSLEALRGDIVVLDFWASWCGPCIYELPTFETIVDEFAVEGVRVIGINLDRSESDFRSAVETNEVSYLQVHDSDVGPIGDLYRIAGIPMTYIIDRNGIIAARGLRGEDLIAAIRELIDRDG